MPSHAVESLRTWFGLPAKRIAFRVPLPADSERDRPARWKHPDDHRSASTKLRFKMIANHTNTRRNKPQRICAPLRPKTGAAGVWHDDLHSVRFASFSFYAFNVRRRQIFANVSIAQSRVGSNPWVGGIALS
jgi:hypothetical protein